VKIFHVIVKNFFKIHFLAVLEFEHRASSLLSRCLPLEPCPQSNIKISKLFLYILRTVYIKLLILNGKTITYYVNWIYLLARFLLDEEGPAHFYPSTSWNNM
jgi:hypothetical protein